MHKLMILLLSCFSALTMHGQATDKVPDVVMLGDSNTQIGGDDCSKEIGWPVWFKRTFAASSCASYARSGATWTNTPSTKRNEEEYSEILGDDNVIYNQVCRLLTAFKKGRQPQPDIIIIGAGTNDAWFNSSRPKAYAVSVSEAFASNQQEFMSGTVDMKQSLAESIRYSVLLLKSNFPNAMIVLTTPPETIKASAEKIRMTGDIIESCGKKLGCNVIRLDKCGVIKSRSERRKFVFTSDGTHTSKRGAKAHGEIIAKAIAQLFM